jgi:hypothetical protein
VQDQRQRRQATAIDQQRRTVDGDGGLTAIGGNRRLDQRGQLDRLLLARRRGERMGAAISR